jgi:ATP-dependent helicase/nuclease subunit A
VFDSQPSLIALAAPKPFAQSGRPTKEQVEASLPDAVAGFIDWLVRKSGWTVEENGARVPVEARHVCILFKRLRGYRGVDLPRPYAAALEARRVPHVLVGGRGFHTREEVIALRTALLAVERPDDELSVFATLRGPFFAFGDEQLLVFKHEVGRLQPLRPFDLQALSPGSAEVAQALGVLAGLHRTRNLRPAASTLQQFLEVTRAHAGVAFWAAGQQALANVLQLGQVARRVEQRSTSFREVVEALQEEADEGEAPDAPIVEEGTDGVRLMTVHAAKGLEFPVVILAEPTAPASRVEPSHWVDPDAGLWVHALAHCLPVELREREAEVLQRDLEEAVRLTYVAATRARDVLVVPVCSEKRFEGTWLSVLDRAVWPSPESRHAPKPAPGCPPFKYDVVLERQGSVPTEVPLPGRHLAEAQKNGVVWWDPLTLELGREARTGLEASEALQDDPVVSPSVREAYERWRLAHVEALERGAKPLHRVLVAREHLVAPEPGRVGVDSTLALRDGRPGGRRFGELVHAALAQVPLDAQREAIVRVVEVHARALLAPSEEQAAAVDAVEAALAHPLFAQARVAKQVRRETPVVDHPVTGEVLEGSIDLAFFDGAQWTVVEFKTDDIYEANRAAYEAQTWVYVRAIAAATGTPTNGVLLRV